MDQLEKEMLNTQLALENGVKLQTTVGDDGMTYSEVFIPEPAGFYTEGDAPTMRELGVTGDPAKVAGAGAATIGGMAGGAVTGIGGMFADLLSMAAGPELQQAADEFKAEYGTEALREMLFQGIDQLEIPEQYKFLMKDAALVGEVTGLPGAIPVAKGAMKAPGMIKEAGQKVMKKSDQPDLGLPDDMQPRFFEPGKFEPPTAENPVSVVMPTETEPGIIAFHGSGADFDKFKLEMIGTGEGAQAYGYGLYFTDSEDIAKFYRDTVRAQKNLSQGADIKYQGKEFVDYGDTAEAEAQPPEYFAVRKIASQMMREKSPDVAKGLVLKKLKAQMANRTGDTEIDDLIRNSLKIEIDAVNAINPNEIQVEKGKIFKVGISAKPEEMLDYQTTFADQPQSVQDALRAVGYDTETASTIEKNGDGRHTVFYIDTKGREARQDFIDGVAGQTSEQQAKEFASKQDEMRSKLPMPVVLDALKETLKKQMEAGEIPVDRPDKVLSERLSAEGVPGIKYRAAGSRAASIDAADAEMNYVIFDENAIKILEKYGIVGPVAITAVAAGQGADSDEGEVM